MTHAATRLSDRLFRRSRGGASSRSVREGMNADIGTSRWRRLSIYCSSRPRPPNIIRQARQRHRRDFLSTSTRRHAPLLVAPAMNADVRARAVRRISTLAARGYLRRPGRGYRLRVDRQGRLAEPDEIVAAAEAVLRRRARCATADPGDNRATYEDVDQSATSGKRSSGRMGCTIAAGGAPRRCDARTGPRRSRCRRSAKWSRCGALATLSGGAVALGQTGRGGGGGGRRPAPAERAGKVKDADSLTRAQETPVAPRRTGASEGRDERWTDPRWIRRRDAGCRQPGVGEAREEARRLHRGQRRVAGGCRVRRRDQRRHDHRTRWRGDAASAVEGARSGRDSQSRGAPARGAASATVRRSRTSSWIDQLKEHLVFAAESASRP